MKRIEGRKNACTESYNRIYGIGGSALVMLHGVVLVWNLVQACGRAVSEEHFAALSLSKTHLA